MRRRPFLFLFFFSSGREIISPVFKTYILLVFYFWLDISFLVLALLLQKGSIQIWLIFICVCYVLLRRLRLLKTLNELYPQCPVINSSAELL